ncbi:hypothetical protein ABVK25_004061 [Lepraria finkii]|uniref:Uncharacterized protein n=1 Tax=Lepraria finkii TaxID=1340010 RepID=A0ABR4BEH9_9LECA
MYIGGLGICSGICSAIKSPKLRELNARGDLTWETYEFYVWSATETFLLIVYGSVPTFKPIYDLARERTHSSLSFFSSRNNSSSPFSSSGTNTQKLSYQKNLDGIPNNGTRDQKCE